MGGGNDDDLFGDDDGYWGEQSAVKGRTTPDAFDNSKTEVEDDDDDDKLFENTDDEWGASDSIMQTTQKSDTHFSSNNMSRTGDTLSSPACVRAPSCAPHCVSPELARVNESSRSAENS